MRVLINDYAGHPFQIQLSRELARRGHSVAHLYVANISGPKGDFADQDDSGRLEIYPITLSSKLAKESLFKRWLLEREYGTASARILREFRPDVVVGCNMPLEALRTLRRETRRRGAAFLFWLQDVHGLAIKSILEKRLGLPGRVVGAYYERLELALLKSSHLIVAIAPAFMDLLSRHGIEDGAVRLLKNWTPLDKRGPGSKVSAWSSSHGLADKKVAMYAGTLGYKHNPELLLALAENAAAADVRVVVISEGHVVEKLKADAAQRGLNNMLVLPFQSFDVLRDVLGSADVLLSVLEPEAGQYSVPSKILTYMAAGRPVLLSAPANNLAAQTLVEAQAGVVVAPGDADGFVQAAIRLLSDDRAAGEMGENGHRFARTEFDIDRIGEKFEGFLAEAIERRAAAPGSQSKAGTQQAVALPRQ